MHRALESSEYARGSQGSLERYCGLPRVVLLTPEGGQLINIGIGRGFVFSVISQKTAARYAVHRSKLPAPVMVAGPANQQVRATEHCTMAFPQEKAVGWKLIIYAFVVDTLEELYETPDGGCRGGRCSWAKRTRDICGGCELHSRATTRSASYPLRR